MEERRDEEEKGGRGLSPAELPGSQGKESRPVQVVQGAGNPRAPRARRAAPHLPRGLTGGRAGGRRAQVAAIGQAGPGG